ncbi:type II toxin-antitoxin system RelE/ParE family toxin [Chryseobacterium oranimense]|uniref:type II toxin-antitoxin system RelE/ParE family toxin n=1 Tax=Chryseobacterium oranimense TaxID=421058 RepID=UPI0021B074D5|nr:type II toxin-antitoxin system RelE/ParE family toxin [Chryseobacterium oranimense]UWX61032.1 type II toxin-antitoxin system RelE/ParE family toxin [Chryseobacterium oranimense]
MKYRISNEALNDLEKIWLYTFENWSLKQADHYFNLIMNEIEYLTNNPESGKDYNKIRKGYFRSRVKSHFIFYKINWKDDEIEIIRILHQQMDISTRLDD